MATNVKKLLAVLFSALLLTLSVGLFAACGGGDEGGGGKTLKITTPPAQVTYVEGDLFDPTGMIVKVVEGSKETEALGYSWSPEGALSASDTKVTISYQGMTVDQPITVTASEPYVVMKAGDATLELGRDGSVKGGSEAGTWYHSGSKIHLNMGGKDYECDRNAEGKYLLEIGGTTYTSTEISELFLTEMTFTGPLTINNYTIMEAEIVLKADGTIDFPQGLDASAQPIEKDTGTWKKTGAELEIIMNGKAVQISYSGGVYSFEYGLGWGGFNAAGLVTFEAPTAFYDLTLQSDHGFCLEGDESKTPVTTIRVANTSLVSLQSKTQLRVGVDTYVANAAGKRIASWTVNGEAKNIGDEFKLTADTTAAAVWRDAKSCTVTFDTGAGSKIEAMTVEEDTMLNIAELSTTYAGHEIEAWHVGTADGATVSGSYQVQDSVTLVVEWDRIPQVRFTGSSGYLKLYEDKTAKMSSLESSVGTWEYDAEADAYIVTLNYDEGEGAFNAAGTSKKSISLKGEANETGKVYSATVKVFAGYSEVTFTYEEKADPVAVFTGTFMDGAMTANVYLYDTGYYVVNLVGLFDYSPAQYTYDETKDVYTFQELNSSEPKAVSTTKEDGAYTLTFSSMVGEITVTYTPGQAA